MRRVKQYGERGSGTEKGFTPPPLFFAFPLNPDYSSGFFKAMACVRARTKTTANNPCGQGLRGMENFSVQAAGTAVVETDRICAGALQA
jgi:hypothetical protein